MKQVIVDYIPFEISPQQINDVMKENNGKLIVKGVLQRAEAKTKTDEYIQERYWFVNLKSMMRIL